MYIRKNIFDLFFNLQARELKSVQLDVTCDFLRLVVS